MDSPGELRELEHLIAKLRGPDDRDVRVGRITLLAHWSRILVASDEVPWGSHHATAFARVDDGRVIACVRTERRWVWLVGTPKVRVVPRWTPAGRQPSKGAELEPPAEWLMDTTEPAADLAGVLEWGAR